MLISSPLKKSHVEPEDARTELERANFTAWDMDNIHEVSDGDDLTGDNIDDDNSAWVEYCLRLLPRMADYVVSPWTRIRYRIRLSRSETVTFPSTSWIHTAKITMGRQ
jgi:hypothetical protein